MSLHLLITGATGLVGTAITRALVQRGYQITALYRTHKNDSLPHTTWVHCDMETADHSFFNSLPEVDVVIHNAAMVPTSGASIDEDAMLKVNSEFSAMLFRWAFLHNVSKVLFTSTYSFLKKPLPDTITEHSEVEPVGVYPNTKWLAEGLLMSMPSGNTKGIALRIPSPVATHLAQSPRNVVRTWIEAAMVGNNISVMGTGSRSMDFVSVEDIAQAFVQAIDAEIEKNEIINLGSGNTLTMRELAEQIASAFDVKIEYQGTDPNASDCWNVSIEKAQTLLGYSPKFTSASAIQALIESAKS
jgi:UDP-glucose 4-epimerase